MLENQASPTTNLDREAILARVDGDEELLAELVGLFLESCQEFLGEVREGIAGKDAVRLRSSAHALKGAIGNFSEGTAFQAARRLEEMGRIGDFTQAEEVGLVLERQVQLLQEELREWIGKMQFWSVESQAE